MQTDPRPEIPVSPYESVTELEQRAEPVQGAPMRPPLPHHQQRDLLEREEREIKDNVLRLGSMVADQVLRAVDALERHDADAALGVIAYRRSGKMKALDLRIELRKRKRAISDSNCRISRFSSSAPKAHTQSSPLRLATSGPVATSSGSPSGRRICQASGRWPLSSSPSRRTTARSRPRRLRRS